MGNWSTKGKPPRYSKSITRNKRWQQWKAHLLVLPYAGRKGEGLIKSMKTTLKYNLPINIVTKSAYSASNLSSKFKIKSKIKQEY